VLWRLARMMCVPMPGDRRSIAEPNGVMPQDVIERTRQRCDASRPADNPAMQADRHHARMAFRTLAVQPIERIATIDEKILADV